MAVYDLNRDTVTMTGDVVLTRGESVVRGDKLVINTVTGLATLDSTAQGRGSKRVRGVFYPEERAQAPTPPAAAARPRVSATTAPAAQRPAAPAPAAAPAARPAAPATAQAPARDR
jgi:hypothetical protein